MRRGLLVALSGLLVLPLGGVATATHGGIHPTFRAEQNFFHCVGDTKVQNLSFAQGQVPSWNTTPPPGSVQAGNGCGYWDPLINNNAPSPVPFYALWRGKSTGNLKNFSVELHRLLPASGATLPNQFVLFVEVDGEERFNGNIVLTPTVSSSNASHKMQFTLQNLGYATEDGDGTQERTITLRLTSFNETQSIWVFDTTEVPAGITFNPPTTQGEVFQAT